MGTLAKAPPRGCVVCPSVSADIECERLAAVGRSGYVRADAGEPVSGHACLRGAPADKVSARKLVAVLAASSL